MLLVFWSEWVLFNRWALLKYSQKIFIIIIIAEKHNLEIMFQEWESARFVTEHAVFNNEHFSELYRTLCVTNLFNVYSDDTMWTLSIMKLNMVSQILNSWCSNTGHFFAVWLFLIYYSCTHKLTCLSESLFSCLHLSLRQIGVHFLHTDVGK